MKHVALLGGAFDPVTIGHIKTAQLVIRSVPYIDEAWFLPCYQSVWGKRMVSAEDRLAMLRLAVQSTNDSSLSVCAFEIENKLTGHTFDILQKFFARYPSNEYGLKFHFAIGMDHANVIHTWGNGHKLIETLSFIVAERGGVKRDMDVRWYLEKPHYFIPENAGSISSTQARKEIAESGTTDLVIPEVMDLIKKRGFYK